MHRMFVLAGLNVCFCLASERAFAQISDRHPFHVVILYFAWLGKPGFAIGGVLGAIAGYRRSRRIPGAIVGGLLGGLLGLVLWLAGWFMFFR